MSGKSPKIQPELTGKRDQFKTRLGFVLAAVGSTLGMGDIWLFPYRVGQFGGAAFLIPYFIFVAFIGYIGIVEETSFGRGTRWGLSAHSPTLWCRQRRIPLSAKHWGSFPR